MQLSIGNCLYLGLSGLSEVPKTMTYMGITDQVPSCLLPFMRH